MDESMDIVKDDWNTILGELDEIIRTTNQLALMMIGDKTALEGEEFPALIHFINELKKEKKSQSWEKIQKFNNMAVENLKFLDETQQIKMQNRRIDRSFIGVLPKNTDQLGTSAIEILHEIPVVLKTINDSVEAMLIDIKLKLGFSIVKFEKEILDIKHQIDLLANEIDSHTKLKKGLLSREGQIIYTQAYRDTYHEILDKAKDYVTRDFTIHSKAYEHVYERYFAKLKNYRDSPAFDDFIKENCIQIEDTISKWPKNGFQAFLDALKFVKKIDHRLSDTRQSFIKQIKSELDKDTKEIIANVEKLYSLESDLDGTNFTKMKAASEKVISKINFLIKTIDVVSEDPHDKLDNDENILLETKNMTTAAYSGTYGSFEEQLSNFIKQIIVSKNTKKILDLIEETKGNCLEPSSLTDAVKAIPTLLNYKQNKDLLLKELAADQTDIQEKFIKKIKNINKYFGQGELVKIPSDEEFIIEEKINLDDLKSLEKIGNLLKKTVAQAAKIIADFEENFSEGLGISINPNLEGKISRYKRPSYKPTIKQANKAINELEKFAKNLMKDTGEAITDYVKDLKKFTVQSGALVSFQKLLRKIGKDAIDGKIPLAQITTKLEQAITEYSKEIASIVSMYKDDLAIIMTNINDINFYEGMTLENFNVKHNNLLNNISLESVIQEQEEEQKELTCRTCGGKIVWQKEDYNDMLGLDVLLVRCENNHEDNIIGFAGDEKEEEKDVIEIKCSKCGSDTLVPTEIDIFTKDALIVTATCPKNHKTDFNIKKK
ncbi:MAG: hypothetical protein FK731_02980 [Asgard group archaeon]|nr:hypothetical protein [Asgard group archaeon]